VYSIEKQCSARQQDADLGMQRNVTDVLWHTEVLREYADKFRFITKHAITALAWSSE
jgi:hypothetical protein